MQNDFTPVEGYVAKEPIRKEARTPIEAPAIRKPEKESEISKKVANRLDVWERWGYVLWSDRYNSGSFPIGSRWVRMCKAGTPDRIAFINVNGVCWIYLIECKAEGKKQSEVQLDFESKFEGMSNVIYEVVYDAKQVDITLDRITNRTDKLLDEADKHMGIM